MVLIVGVVCVFVWRGRGDCRGGVVLVLVVRVGSDGTDGGLWCIRVSGGSGVVCGWVGEGGVMVVVVEVVVVGGQGEWRQLGVLKVWGRR